MNLDIMVDLETYGTGTKAAIAQIAAVPFIRNITTEESPVFNTFNSYISQIANREAGLEEDQATIEWWSKQSPEVFHRVISKAQDSPNSLKDALTAFAHYLDYLRDVHGATGLRIWGNGSVFDNRILMAAYIAAGLKLPWKYNEDRDLRTLLDIGEAMGLAPKKLTFQGIQHDAIDDCRHQIRQAQLVFSSIDHLAAQI